jgi:hypothetical protein
MILLICPDSLILFFIHGLNIFMPNMMLIVSMISSFLRKVLREDVDITFYGIL